MAGEELQSALGGLAFSGMDNPYGIAASALGAATPGMISPYASTGQALGIGLGSILLQSLLGYQARQTALQDTLQANTLANQMLKLQTPEERVSFIGGLDESPQIASRLSTLSTALQQQELARKVAQDAKIAELTTGAEFELGPLGSELFKRKQQAEIDKAVAVANAAAATRQPTRQQLPTGVQTAITDASTFADAAKQQRDRIAAMDPVKLKAVLTSGFNLGEAGFNQTNEAVVQLYRKANFGATLTGQEKKAADIITGKNLTATKADIVAAWDTLIDLNNKRAQRAVEVATSTPEQLTQMFGVTPGGTTTVAPDAKLKKLQELQAQLAELKARRGAK